MRQWIAELVESTGEFVVVGTAGDGEAALAQIADCDPELITLDVDMPRLDGLAALERIMQESPRRVVMLSAGTSDDGADATLRASHRAPSASISMWSRSLCSWRCGLPLWPRFPHRDQCARPVPMPRSRPQQHRSW
jgi:chemotaxis response regulator CheB